MIVGDDTRTRVRSGPPNRVTPHVATTLGRPREDPRRTYGKTRDRFIRAVGPVRPALRRRFVCAAPERLADGPDVRIRRGGRRGRDGEGRRPSGRGMSAGSVCGSLAAVALVAEFVRLGKRSSPGSAPTSWLLRRTRTHSVSERSRGCSSRRATTSRPRHMWPVSGNAATGGRRGRLLVSFGGSAISRSRRASPQPECLQEGCKHSVLGFATSRFRRYWRPGPPKPGRARRRARSTSGRPLRPSIAGAVPSQNGNPLRAPPRGVDLFLAKSGSEDVPGCRSAVSSSRYPTAPPGVGV